MFGWMRNALAIGLIAYFSPVHEQDMGTRVQALAHHAKQAERIGQAAQASGPIMAKAAGTAAATGNGAGIAAQVFEPASHKALARLIDIALASDEGGTR